MEEFERDDVLRLARFLSSARSLIGSIWLTADEIVISTGADNEELQSELQSFFELMCEIAPLDKFAVDQDLFEQWLAAHIGLRIGGLSLMRKGDRWQVASAAETTPIDRFELNDAAGTVPAAAHRVHIEKEMTGDEGG